jgi:hypothetical protein
MLLRGYEDANPSCTDPLMGPRGYVISPSYDGADIVVAGNGELYDSYDGPTIVSVVYAGGSLA